MFESVTIQKPWTSKVSLQNGWLSGFLDAEGCFYAHYKLSKRPSYFGGLLSLKITLT